LENDFFNKRSKILKAPGLFFSKVQQIQFTLKKSASYTDGTTMATSPYFTFPLQPYITFIYMIA